jgi:uroporphyrinogen decarboxylase
MAYALYPEVMEMDFRLQADLAVKRNRIAGRAFVRGNLPKLLRLDHDMTDSRGTLVDIKSLDDIWFPHFARSLEPYHDAGIRLIWHCDGNVTPMVPRLTECGVRGFQGFQYEDGVDYVEICRMRDRDGEPLMIWAGVSVTKTLPFGTPENVRDEMRWLVENGPPVGLFLGGSSSIAPGTNRDNIRAMMEGIRYYRKHGRTGK